MESGEARVTFGVMDRTGAIVKPGYVTLTPDGIQFTIANTLKEVVTGQDWMISFSEIQSVDFERRRFRKLLKIKTVHETKWLQLQRGKSEEWARNYDALAPS